MKQNAHNCKALFLAAIEKMATMDWSGDIRAAKVCVGALFHRCSTYYMLPAFCAGYQDGCTPCFPRVPRLSPVPHWSLMNSVTLSVFSPFFSAHAAPLTSKVPAYFFAKFPDLAGSLHSNNTRPLNNTSTFHSNTTRPPRRFLTPPQDKVQSSVMMPKAIEIALENID